MVQVYCLWYKYVNQLLLRCITCTVEISPLNMYNVFHVRSLTKKHSYERNFQAINICFTDDKQWNGIECEFLVCGDLASKWSLCNSKNYQCAIESYMVFGKIFPIVSEYKEDDIFQSTNTVLNLNNTVKINTRFPSVKKIVHVIIHITCAYIAFVMVISRNTYKHNAYNLARLYIDRHLKKHGRPFILHLIGLLATHPGIKKQWFLDIIDHNTLYIHQDLWLILNDCYSGVFTQVLFTDNAYILRTCHPKLIPAIIVTTVPNPKNLLVIKHLSFPNRITQLFLERLYIGGLWVQKFETTNILETKTVNSLKFYAMLYQCSDEKHGEIVGGTFEFFMKIKDFYSPDFGVLLPSSRRIQTQPKSDIVYKYFPLNTCILHLNSYQDLLTGFYKLFDTYAKKGDLLSFKM